jgi:murein DD-endopeptidase MepM/ murein hydrolase activator NlpD/GH24 family phage-related lysozyme (muramidase)
MLVNFTKNAAKSFGLSYIQSMKNRLSGQEDFKSQAKEMIGAFKQESFELKDFLRDRVADRILGRAYENTKESLKSGRFVRDKAAVEKDMMKSFFGEEGEEDMFSEDFLADDDDFSSDDSGDETTGEDEVVKNDNRKYTKNVKNIVVTDTSGTQDLLSHQHLQSKISVKANKALLSSIGRTNFILERMYSSSKEQTELLSRIYNEDSMASKTFRESVLLVNFEAILSQLQEINKMTQVSIGVISRKDINKVIETSSFDTSGFDASGYFNPSGYVKQLFEKVKSPFEILDLAETQLAHPIETISNFITGMLIPDKVGKAFDRKSKFFETLIPTINFKLQEWAEKDITEKDGLMGHIKKAIGKFFGVDSTSILDYSKLMKSDLDEVTQFDIMTKKAITEVIPGYLSKILGAISKSGREEELIYDYKTGRFISVAQAREDFDTTVKGTNILDDYLMQHELKAMEKITGKFKMYDKMNESNQGIVQEQIAMAFKLWQNQPGMGVDIKSDSIPKNVKTAFAEFMKSLSGVQFQEVLALKHAASFEKKNALEELYKSSKEGTSSSVTERLLLAGEEINEEFEAARDDLEYLTEIYQQKKKGINATELAAAASPGRLKYLRELKKSGTKLSQFQDIQLRTLEAREKFEKLGDLRRAEVGANYDESRMLRSFSLKTGAIELTDDAKEEKARRDAKKGDKRNISDKVLDFFRDPVQAIANSVESGVDAYTDILTGEERGLEKVKTLDKLKVLRSVVLEIASDGFEINMANAKEVLEKLSMILQGHGVKGLSSLAEKIPSMAGNIKNVQDLIIGGGQKGTALEAFGKGMGLYDGQFAKGGSGEGVAKVGEDGEEIVVSGDKGFSVFNKEQLQKISTSSVQVVASIFTKGFKGAFKQLFGKDGPIRIAFSEAFQDDKEGFFKNQGTGKNIFKTALAGYGALQGAGVGATVGSAIGMGPIGMLAGGAIGAFATGQVAKILTEEGGYYDKLKAYGKKFLDETIFNEGTGRGLGKASFAGIGAMKGAAIGGVFGLPGIIAGGALGAVAGGHIGDAIFTKGGYADKLKKYGEDFFKNVIMNESKGKGLAKLGMAGVGAMHGAKIGSIFGPFGTIAGGAMGAIAGGRFGDVLLQEGGIFDRLKQGGKNLLSRFYGKEGEGIDKSKLGVAITGSYIGAKLGSHFGIYGTIAGGALGGLVAHKWGEQLLRPGGPFEYVQNKGKSLLKKMLGGEEMGSTLTGSLIGAKIGSAAFGGGPFGAILGGVLGGIGGKLIGKFLLPKILKWFAKILPEKKKEAEAEEAKIDIEQEKVETEQKIEQEVSKIGSLLERILKAVGGESSPNPMSDNTTSESSDESKSEESTSDASPVEKSKTDFGIKKALIEESTFAKETFKFIWDEKVVGKDGIFTKIHSKFFDKKKGIFSGKNVLGPEGRIFGKKGLFGKEGTLVKSLNFIFGKEGVLVKSWHGFMWTMKMGWAALLVTMKVGWAALMLTMKAASFLGGGALTGGKALGAAALPAGKALGGAALTGGKALGVGAKALGTGALVGGKAALASGLLGAGAAVAGAGAAGAAIGYGLDKFVLNKYIFEPARERKREAEAKEYREASNKRQYGLDKLKNTLKNDSLSFLDADRILGAGWENLSREEIDEQVEKYSNNIDSVSTIDLNKTKVEGRATGGKVEKSKPYIVGENESELFVPEKDGMVLNQKQMAQVLSKSFGNQIYTNTYRALFEILKHRDFGIFGENGPFFGSKGIFGDDGKLFGKDMPLEPDYKKKGLYQKVSEAISDAGETAVSAVRQTANYGVKKAGGALKSLGSFAMKALGMRTADSSKSSYSGALAKIVWPPADGRFTSPFGPRASYGGRMHNGIDIAPDVPGVEGSPIYSISDGTVITAGKSDSAGNWIQIRHGDGSISEYMHLSGMNVKVGDEVKAGQHIGAMGNSGKSDGSHLHFGFRDPSGNYLNPEIFGPLGNPKSGDAILAGTGSSIDLKATDIDHASSAYYNEGQFSSKESGGLNLKDWIKQEEGFRSETYIDTEGYPTIGYGHKLKPGESFPGGISKADADKLFEQDFAEHQAEASKIPEYLKSPDIITAMTYQMGKGGVMGFENMRKKLAAGDMEGAAAEMMDSKWARQTPARAQRTSEFLLAGGGLDSSLLPSSELAMSSPYSLNNPSYAPAMIKAPISSSSSSGDSISERILQVLEEIAMNTAMTSDNLAKLDTDMLASNKPNNLNIFAGDKTAASTPIPLVPKPISKEVDKIAQG